MFVSACSNAQPRRLLLARRQSGNSRRCWSSGRTSKTKYFLEEGSFFFARKRKKRCWVFFSPFGGVLMLLGGVFVLFWGVFVLFVFFVFRASSARNVWGELIFQSLPHPNGEFPLCTARAGLCLCLIHHHHPPERDEKTPQTPPTPCLCVASARHGGDNAAFCSRRPRKNRLRRPFLCHWN